jgi:hypothetical protein
MIFVGPAPDSGYHLIDESGVLNDNITGNNNVNLLNQIDRVFAFNYSVDQSPTLLKQLGTKSLVARPVIEYPNVNVDFEYYVNSIKNEARLGFDVNFRTGDEPYYASRVCPISGFTSRELVRQRGNPFWIYTHKDARNIFAVIAPEGDEVRESTMDFVQTPFDIANDENSLQYGVLAFGSCYLTSYQIQASVGDIPRAKVSYVSDNIQFTISGNEVMTPYLNKTTAIPTRDKHFKIPKSVNEGGVSAIKPGDIDVEISGHGKIHDIGTDFNDTKIQSFSIAIPLGREDLPKLGAKLPVDRQINFPIISTVSFQYLQGDLTSGSIAELFSGDAEYNFKIKMNNSSGCSPDKEIIVQYDILGAILKSHSSSSSLKSNKMGAVTFEVELDPDNLHKGIFISGLASIETLNGLANYL